MPTFDDTVVIALAQFLKIYKTSIRPSISDLNQYIANNNFFSQVPQKGDQTDSKQTNIVKNKKTDVKQEKVEV